MVDTPTYGTCPVCGYRMVPLTRLSPCGHDAALEPSPLESTGVVYSFTRSWSSPTKQVLIAMVDLPDVDLRLCGPVKDAEDLRIGDVVTIHVGTSTPFELRPAG